MTDPWLERLVPAPRAVPLSLKVRLRLGGVFGLMGWIFTAFSMVFVLALVGGGGLGTALRLGLADLDGSLAVAQGTITHWAETNAEVNEQPVIANHARFEVKGRGRWAGRVCRGRRAPCSADGRAPYTCESYAVARGLAPDEPVMVEYHRDRPALCRIVGMSASQMPWWVLLILSPFLLIGIIFSALAWRRGARLVRLLRHGQPAYATVLGSRRTNVTINEDPVWEVSLRYTDAQGRSHDIQHRTVDVEELGDDPREGLLYDPEHPENAHPIDTLPDGVDTDRQGRWQAAGVGPLIGLSVAPALSLLLLILTILNF